MEPTNIQFAQKKEVTITFENMEVALSCLMGIKDRLYIDDYIAEQLKAQDPQEQYLHLEKLEKFSGVWRIREWKASEQRRKILEEAQKNTQKKCFLIKELQDKLLDAIHKKMGGKREDHIIMANCILMAKEKGIAIAKELYNVDISEAKEL